MVLGRRVSPTGLGSVFVFVLLGRMAKIEEDCPSKFFQLPKWCFWPSSKSVLSGWPARSDFGNNSFKITLEFQESNAGVLKMFGRRMAEIRTDQKFTFSKSLKLTIGDGTL